MRGIEEKLRSLDSVRAFSAEEMVGCQRTVQETHRAIQKKEVTLEEQLLLLHQRRQQLNNCYNSLTEVLMDQPLQQARKIDLAVAENMNRAMSEYPLAGCILSISDSIPYAGTSSTCGLSRCHSIVFTTTAGLIAFLESKGALVTCKGNVSQGLMACESDNHLFGSVSHPLDKKRSAGGSAGGDAVNVASLVVNCAIGSDIMGGIRCPALFCGLFAFKPTAGRFPQCEAAVTERWEDFDWNGSPQSLIVPTCGPICRSANDIALLMRAMSEYNLQSLEVAPLAWDAVEAPKRVGVLTEFSRIMGVCSATDRALLDALQCGGFESVAIDLNDIIIDLVVHRCDVEFFVSLNLTLSSLACYLKSERFVRFLKGKIAMKEPLIEAYDYFRKYLAYPIPLLRFMLKLSFVISPREKIYVEAYLLSIDKCEDSLLNSLKLHREDVLSRFRASNINICLAHGLFPAFPKGTAKDVDLSMMYCFVWNYLNFPVGTVPITTVRADEQKYESQFTDRITEALISNMDGSSGLPVGIQVVGLPWHDEVVVETMIALEASLGRCAQSYFVLN